MCIFYVLEWNRRIEKPNELTQSPCGRKYSSYNGTIEFNSEINTSLDCLIFIEVDDGQNILLRFDYLNWDTRENLMEIGLFHEYNQNQIFRISGRELTNNSLLLIECFRYTSGYMVYFK
jgi:hypothetical protein